MPTYFFNGSRAGWRWCCSHLSRIPAGGQTARLRYTFTFFLTMISWIAAAQTDSTPVFKDAVAANRAKTYNSIVKNIITKNLSLPLNYSTEENWQGAFDAMEVLQYKQPWLQQKIKLAFDSAEKRSLPFQRALLELVYTNYPVQFTEEVYRLAANTDNAKIFAMAVSYIGKADSSQLGALLLLGATRLPALRMADTSKKNLAILQALEHSVTAAAEKITAKKLKPLFSASFLSGNTIVYSIQRRNRNYPGMAIVRDGSGNLMTDSSGNLFAVPQLARSITNLPGFLTNGNTPQGIFRLNGFAVSKSAAIGPTENIQMMMPFETSPQFFLKDSSITDTAWTKELYSRLLPGTLKEYHALFGTYMASACGRTEIIAHGTTVDPSFYKGQTYYPLTPTQGCLCTTEIWSDTDGKRTVSDQQKLVDAVKKAGGANGYCVVIEMDDQQKPVSMEEILLYVKAAIK